MRNFIISLLFLFQVLNALSQDSWSFTEDKQYHFIAGYGIGVIVPLFVRKNVIPVSISVGVFVGGGKEIYDYFSPTGTASFQDFTYTIAGTVTSSFLVGPKIALIHSHKFKNFH